MQADLKRAIEERRARYARFAAWEDRQLTNASSLEQRLDWYADALRLATRTGGAGRGTSETHLNDIVSWVQRWRRAWRAG